jgi:hypothetical protein
MYNGMERMIEYERLDENREWALGEAQEPPRLI